MALKRRQKLVLICSIRNINFVTFSAQFAYPLTFPSILYSKISPWAELLPTQGLCPDIISSGASVLTPDCPDTTSASEGQSRELQEMKVSMFWMLSCLVMEQSFRCQAPVWGNDSRRGEAELQTPEQTKTWFSKKMVQFSFKTVITLNCGRHRTATWDITDGTPLTPRWNEM